MRLEAVRADAARLAALEAEAVDAKRRAEREAAATEIAAKASETAAATAHEWRQRLIDAAGEAEEEAERQEELEVGDTGL